MNRTRRGEQPWPHCCVELDRRDDPAAFIAEDSVLWAVVKGHRRRGFHKLLIPGAFGGLMGKVPPVTGALLSEQFGHADAGPAVSLSVLSNGKRDALYILRIRRSSCRRK